MHTAPKVSLSGDVFAVDYESFYDSKAKYSLKNMEPYAYVRHPLFDAYLVSVVSDSGDEYVGDPAGFDWLCLSGKTLLAHNVGFDATVTERLIELGVIPDFERRSPGWLDTADLAAYLNVPRSLKDACRELLGVTISKKARSDMDGVRWADLDPVQRQVMIDYAADDSRLCLRLWQEHGDRWPEIERMISRVNREACARGIRCDRAGIVEGLKVLREAQAKAAAQLPWFVPDSPKESQKPGSRPAFLMHAKSLGLPVPHSIKKDDPEMQAWVKRYGDDPRYGFIKARLAYASVTPHIARLESMLERLDGEDVMRFSSLYFGAHTGRSSGREDSESGGGGGKVNMFNIPKGDRKTGLTHGVNMRKLLLPRPGKVFAVYDFSQVEPRTAHWLAGNTAFLSRVEREDIYQAAAKVLGWYPDDKFDLKHDDPKTRDLAKACTIGLGYRMSGAKFVLTCEKMGIELGSVPKEAWNLDRRAKFMLRNVAHLDFNDPADEAAVCKFLAADRIVTTWRNANAPLVDLWGSLQREVEASAAKGERVHEFVLPSGRIKTYFNPHFSVEMKATKDPETGVEETRVEKRLYASVIKGTPATSLHGGILLENLVQALTRDIMFWGAMDVVRERPTWNYITNVYDEVLFELPEDDASDAEKLIPECLCHGSASAWTKGLPLAVDGGIKTCYCK